MVIFYSDIYTHYRIIRSFQNYLALQDDVTTITTWVSENFLALNIDTIYIESQEVFE